ncbi:hypothetical protein GC175_03935 [bacterium]|nr:hypothetical protein [bacterium]
MEQALSGLIDASLLFTIGLVFLVTLVGSYLRSRRKDPCLASFEDFHVTLERTDDKIVWGKLEIESTGLELLYRDDVQDEAHIESSYILYANEYENMQAIYRYADQLTPEGKQKRRRDIERSFHPGAWERSKRGLRAFVSTANDSLSEVFGLLVGRAKKPAGRYITDQGEAYLNKLGVNLIGHVGGVFDPLLERYIGQKVVVEIQEGDEVHEHVGIFKNYSPDFIEILDVQYPEPRLVDLNDCDDEREECVQVKMEDTKMTVHNPTRQPVLLHSLVFGEETELFNVVVDSGESVELFLQEVTEDAVLHVRMVRELDLIVPRTLCVVRHRAERFKPELLADIIFDVGFLLNPDRREDKMEERLRCRLKDAPWDGLAAANLATILLKKQEFEEARRWLRQALRVRYSLPDNGRRAEMELRELNRRSSSHKSSPKLPPSATESLQTKGETQAVPFSLQTSNGAGPRVQVTDAKT